MLHEGTVERPTLELIKKLSQDKELQDFVLVGGTALALQIGHRRSLDIDLFSGHDMQVRPLLRHLESAYDAHILTTTGNGIFGYIDNIKTTLLGHPYPAIRPAIATDGVRMASIDDIGAMKIHAVVNSGKRAKDFADVYYLLEHRSYEDLLTSYEAKYGGNETMARYGLLHQKDALYSGELDMLLRPFSWKEINARLKQAVIQPTVIFPKTIAGEKKIGLEEKPPLKEHKKRGKRL